MRWKTKVALGVFGAYLAYKLFNQHDSPEERFIKFSVALEAQQVPMYQRLALMARKQRHHHLATGLEKAMEIEQKHLMDLQVQAGRLRVNQTPWRVLGHGVGMITGSILARVKTPTALKTISTIEQLAINDYNRARLATSDEQLRRLYLSNQVDEEFHRAWADSVLDQWVSRE